MKVAKVITLCLSVVLVGGVAFSAWTTFDYGLYCSKCLASKHVVEQQLFRLTVSRTTKDREPGADYVRIFGHPCEHVFHQAGYGRRERSLFWGSMIGCGVTGEGCFIRPRLEAVSAAYRAESDFHDRDLTLATFQLIDTLMPPDQAMPQRRDFPGFDQKPIYLLSHYLRRAKTVEQWQAVLDAAREDFRDTSNLPTE
jgi:hypothetical protein